MDGFDFQFGKDFNYPESHCCNCGKVYFTTNGCPKTSAGPEFKFVANNGLDDNSHTANVRCCADDGGTCTSRADDASGTATCEEGLMAVYGSLFLSR